MEEQDFLYLLLLELVLHYFGVEVLLEDLAVAAALLHLRLDIQLVIILVELEMIPQLHHLKEILGAMELVVLPQEVVVLEEVVVVLLQDLLASEEPT